MEIRHPLADPQADKTQKYMDFGHENMQALTDAVMKDARVGVGYHSLRKVVEALKLRTTEHPVEVMQLQAIVEGASSVVDGVKNIGCYIEANRPYEMQSVSYNHGL